MLKNKIEEYAARANVMKCWNTSENREYALNISKLCGEERGWLKSEIEGL